MGRKTNLLIVGGVIIFVGLLILFGIFMSKKDHFIGSSGSIICSIQDSTGKYLQANADGSLCFRGTSVSPGTTWLAELNGLYYSFKNKQTGMYISLTNDGHILANASSSSSDSSKWSVLPVNNNRNGKDLLVHKMSSIYQALYAKSCIGCVEMCPISITVDSTNDLRNVDPAGVITILPLV